MPDKQIPELLWYGKSALAAEIKALRAERDALRAQLDAMTTEYEARVDSYRSDEAGWNEVDVRTARYIQENPETYPHGHLRQRLVGPWVEVTD